MLYRFIPFSFLARLQGGIRSGARLSRSLIGIAALSGAVQAADFAEAVDFTITLPDGTQANGVAAFPEKTAPAAIERLVIVAHGFGHSVREKGWKRHLEEIASHNALAVAMDYPPCFDLDQGAAETAAAARYFRTRYPDIKTTYLLSVSMGTAVAGMTLAENPGLFDWWVNIEGLSNLIETYSEAVAAAPAIATAAQAKACIETDTGGTPATAGEAYIQRTAVLRDREIANSGIQGSIVVHAVNDGLVTYNQGREMAILLAAKSMPVDFYSVLRGACQDDDTRLSGLLTDPLNVKSDPACPAGHATETSNSLVMRTGLNALFMLMNQRRVPSGYGEFIVDYPAP